MRAVVQRVLKGSVTAEGEVVGSIGHGICVLLGISRDDDHTDSDYVIRKLLTLKLFSDDPEKRWMKSVKEGDLEILVVSQFTLCHTFKGTKPDFHLSMSGDLSKPFFEEFVARLKKEYRAGKVQTGKFGCHMSIDICADGPVTLVIDSPAKKDAGDKK
ncbi:D-aminoacyl-tRNA deacylase 1 [Fragariocoptes setiger]|uniref:D-aminoacyl-tRNA deacylase n=1 Tax=Fragariocoptes setiger TaxID=1670756 RepID=A0ABQ7S7X3_9ACAR|nr:D-aminoacyl-tRNA deacylase 1 [Fragariocoptes setiger]